MENLISRFIRYTAIDTQSNENLTSCPSSAKQLDLANLLVDELKAIGLTNAEIDSNGYVMAQLPASSGCAHVPALGFVAHYDTSPDFIGTGVRPKFVRSYNGDDIVLNEDLQIVLSPKDFPILRNYVGKTLITTDGTTLLGADDKAGIAEIMTAMEQLIAQPELLHGKICICFTPDEEIGRGADLFDVDKFGAKYAYTLDGGEEGELEYENFNAAGARITIQGRSVHPGTAKNQLINSQLLGMELQQMLPVAQRAELTEGYEGFFLLVDFSGNVDKTQMKYIIRDHDREKFEQKKILMQEIVFFLNKKYGKDTFILDLKDQYYNMREKVEPVKFIVDIAEAAMTEIGVRPIKKPIRGGTDGARLSFMGLPTPNLFTGGHNYHGRYEFAVVETMEKAVELIVRIVQKFTAL